MKEKKTVMRLTAVWRSRAATLIFNIAKEKAKTTIYCFQVFWLKLKQEILFQPDTQDPSDDDPEKIFCFNVGGKRWILNNIAALEFKLNIYLL